MKKSSLMLGVLALALTFGVAQQAEAQIRNAAQRDNTLLDGFASFPYYVVMAGDTVNKTAAKAVIEVLGPVEVEGAHYAIVSGALYIAFASARGGRCVAIQFHDTLEKAEQAKATNEASGSTLFGPFESGTTDASRKASLGRILAAVKAYIAKPDTIPQKW
jgi:hypothetical protein